MLIMIVLHFSEVNKGNQLLYSSVATPPLIFQLILKIFIHHRPWLNTRPLTTDVLKSHRRISDFFGYFSTNILLCVIL